MPPLASFARGWACISRHSGPGQFADFTYGEPPPTSSQKINQLIVTQAFKPGRRRRSQRGRNREVIAALIGGVIAICFILALIYLATHDLLTG